jgi:predicted HicB family RNase H-like nuclease
MPRDAAIVVRVTTELKRALEDLAAHQQRSLSGLVNMLLVDAVARAVEQKGLRGRRRSIGRRT